MTERRAWAAFPATYRQEEMARLAQWIAAGVSGSVIGLPGCGRSNLLGFLCHRPQVLASYLPPQVGQVAVLPVDLNNLPATDLSTFYRVVLRSFYRARDRFVPALQQEIRRLYLENQDQQDPFLPQSALQETLFVFREEQIRVVLVLNYFDRFLQVATFQMINTLRGLRDEFKNTLCFIVGMSQELAYLPDPGRLGEMYELLDSYVCRVGAMNEADARFLIAQNTRIASRPLNEAEIEAMLRLTGGFPSLLKAVCHWWLAKAAGLPVDKWPSVLAMERSLEYRLAKIWNGLTQEEQLALALVWELQDKAARQTEQSRGELQRACGELDQRYRRILFRLGDKGLCRQTEWGWRMVGDLLTAYARHVGPSGRGKIRVDAKTHEIYQGLTPLRHLTPLEENLLRFLTKHPYTRHTKTDLIANTWAEPDQVTIVDNDLQQLVAGLRKKIDFKPPRYIITWMGNPQGGYQFFPEGRPE